MDLIDRSKLHSVCVVDGIDSEGVITTRSFWAADVANAPTVEAIPIEWLKELQTKYLEAECFMSVCVVNEILNLWGKENEID